ncbi:hypothetical protein [Mucilaginibacter sp.]
MVNLQTFTFKSEQRERTLYLSPVLLQANKLPIFKAGELTIYVYENFVVQDYDKLALEDGELKWMEDGQLKTTIESRIKHDQDFEKVYLGSVYKNFNVKGEWQWQEKGTPLKADEVTLLINELNRRSQDESA